MSSASADRPQLKVAGRYNLARQKLIYVRTWRVTPVPVLPNGLVTSWPTTNDPSATILVLGLTGNLQYKGDQELSNSIPGVIQDAYTTVAANIRLRSQDGRWQLALIGKNLTDEQAFRGAGDVPETGGNTGTAEGFRGDYSGGVIRPKQFELEFMYRF